MLRLALAALFATMPATAFAYDNPRDVIWALYTPYTNNADRIDYDPLLSVGLALLYEQDRADAGGEIGRIDFDPFIVGQDYLITDFDVSDVDILGGTAGVTGTFKNMDQPLTSVYALVLEKDGWKIDDVVNLEPDGDPSYSLREILTQPFP